MSADSSLSRFNLLKAHIVPYERIAGVYILDAVSISTPPATATSLDSILRGFAATFGFVEPYVGEAEWTQSEVFREDARLKLFQCLVGGAEIGHSRWDVPPTVAEAIVDEFLAIFDEHARFFCHGETADFGPSGRPDFMDYIFGGGCIAIDQNLAAMVWVLDND